MGECQQNNSLVDIYMGKSFDVLESKSVNFPNEKIKSLSVLKLSKCCRKLLDEAISSYDIGDQEMAYVKYSRYFTIMRIIRDSHHYEKYKEEIYQILGSDEEQMECINRMEALTKSLNQRYKQLAADEKKYNRPIELHNPYILSPKSELEKARKKPKCSCHKLPDLSCRRYITCSEFYKMLESSLSAAPNEIIIDCRPYNDYFVSRIVHPCVINIDEEKIQFGATAVQLVSNLSKENLLVWKNRGNMKNVIILDWNTIEDEPIYDSPLYILMSILTLWDPDVVYPSLKFVKGGYADFVKYYPEHTTNSEVTPPCRISPAKAEAIEYATFADIPMKEESFIVHQKNVPVIDCETDPDSLKKFNVKIIKEMVEKREELADKSISLENKRHDLEEKLQTALVEQKNAQDEQAKEESIEKVTQLENNVMELENKAHDILEENLIVTEQINEKQASISDAVPIEKIKEIEEKEREAQKLKELNEQLQLQLLLYMRDISPLKSPVIDRSLLPKMPYNIEELEPVLPDANVVVDRGITGLKNLGKTSFMNSIFQCISNTNSLTICFLTEMYKKYMENESDESVILPKNLIVEHVANLVRALWSGKYTRLTPRTTFDMLSKIYKNFECDVDQNAMKFLDMLLKALHTGLRIAPTEPTRIDIPAWSRAWKTWQDMNKSIITDLFYGQINVTIKCMECDEESWRNYSFNHILLSLLQSDERRNVSDYLNFYFGGDQSQYKCPLCGKSSDAIFKSNIARLPSILVLVFARNEDDGDEVVHTCVDFPITNLEMTDYISPTLKRYYLRKEIKTIEYDLYAIVNQYRGQTDTHYTAFCRNVILKRWYRFDDSIVTAVKESELVSSAAYMLFYSKLPESEPPEIK